MAFCDLNSVRVYDEASGYTYVIGDVFAAFPFGSDMPIVFSWDMLSSVTETRKNIVFKAEGFSGTLSKSSFIVPEDYFRTLAIIEQVQPSAGFTYNHEKRILPLKSSYIECSAGKDAYIGQSELDEADFAATFIMLLNFKLVKFLWLIAILIMLLIFAGLHLVVGVTRDNLLYFIPISAACGGIITLIIYLICQGVARGKYQSMASADAASKEIITFVISQYGFAVCESCTYDCQDIIPWTTMDYFIESNKMFIFYKDNKAAVYIPKKAFDKKYYGGIADMIALHLEQK